MERGGIVVLRGNLAPDGAVLKPSAASPHLMRHRGRAVVFENIEHYKERIDNPDLEIDENCILVLKNCGPKGYPGMAEVGNMSLPSKLLKRGITDMVRIFACTHERNSIRDGCAARLSGGSGRWESCSGTGRRFHRIRRGIPARPPRCFARRVGAAAHAVAASGEPDERRLSTALCGARNAGEYGRRPGFLDGLPRRCNPARVALVHLSDGFMLKRE